MDNTDLDRLLAQSATAPEVDRALVDRISASMRESLVPVRPLPSRVALASGLAAIVVVVAVAAAAALGFYGIAKLSRVEAAIIFAVLAVLSGTAATLSTAEMSPGSRRILSPGSLLAIAIMATAAMFAILFHDYSTHRFVPLGFACLRAGVLIAIPALAAGWLLLRRGFAVNRAGAGIALGIAASLAGLIMLELHCPILETLHVVVWHVAVIPVSALLGWALLRAVSRRA